MTTLVKVDKADVLTDVIDALGVRGRLFCSTLLSLPWGLDFQREGFSHFHVIEEGRAWLRVGGGEPVLLERGDLVLLPHGAGHSLADPPGAPAVPIRKFLRLAGGPGAGAAPTRLLCGSITYERGREHPLFAALPPLILIRGESGQTSRWIDLTLRLLAEESRETGQGTEAVVSHLSGIVLVHAIRHWLAASDGDATGWVGALRDRQIALALACIHRDYAREWSVASLARTVGMSRTAFAARFTALVGETPAAYLTRWRMQIAASRLRGSSDGLVDIAEHVGYQTEAALSKAFKRHFGVAPGSYRRGATAAVQPVQ